MEKVLKQYRKLNEDEIKALVVDEKWLTFLTTAMHRELDRVSMTLSGRIRELADRYATPLPKLIREVEIYSQRVDKYLEKMGAVWR